MTDEEFPYPRTSASIEEAWKTIIRPQLVAQGGRAREAKGCCVLVTAYGRVCAIGALLLPSERVGHVNEVSLLEGASVSMENRHPWLFANVAVMGRLIRAHDHGPWPPPEELP